ncbi:electron transfer flavoprotein subunit beta/FixA family protein [Sulfurospirillum multivorans]|uniref:Electron transfer flavoprotein, beta subunit n=2 Tax=Sulfurospirillum multivorans TaxID=66821 RepID=A0AA86E0Q4_SULMK|nr:hypothetical protein [Sulfurospirillum multivorans]AHJ14245.1 electron transfer flavoprotein, beta subunit [Sulfurospirillum multivorans DSM 12446]QEH07730.1 electron transfer flavoprotein, beta subunit [Sulfurospirillum multivorans]
MVAGEDDPAALDAAKTMAEGSETEIVGITIGDGDASWILARGVQETFSVADVPNLTDQATIGKILASVVKRTKDIDVIVIGDPKSYSGVPVSLAGSLGWPSIMELTSAKIEGDKIIATRHVGSEEQTITISTPVVLGFVAKSEEKRTPGMKEMLMARKRPINKILLSDLNIIVDDRIDSRGSRAPEVKYAHLFEGNPSDSAAQLIDALRKEGVL